MKSLVKYLTEEDAVACVGKGWESLVRRVYNAKIGIGTPVGIIQVKEKWGGLRIYTDYYDEQLEPIIKQVGEESLTICERCGSPASLVQKGAWYQTRCGIHADDWVPIHD
jgi:hypothetical protein